jgi:hypothetical protein
MDRLERGERPGAEQREVGPERRIEMGLAAALCIDEDHSAPLCQPQRHETVVGSLETLDLAGAAGRDQPAGQVIGPGVVWAGQERPRERAGALGANLGPAVPADIVEGGEPAVAAAHRDDVHAGDAPRQVARRRL